MYSEKVPYIKILQYMTEGVLLRETLKDSDLDKYQYVLYYSFFSPLCNSWGNWFTAVFFLDNHDLHKYISYAYPVDLLLVLFSASPIWGWNKVISLA